MRWRYPRTGDVRTRVRFAWLPIDWEGTTYWLERVRVVEMYDTLHARYVGVGWRITDLEPFRGKP